MTAAHLPHSTNYYHYRTAFGMLTIAARDQSVVAVELGAQTMDGAFEPSVTSNACATQIMEYLAGKRTAFTVPFFAEGSAFQQSVWQAVENIPYGQTRTSRQIAASLGTPDSYRKVGSALAKNPLLILIPTHRVVTSMGKPAGSGRAAQINHALLALEERMGTLS